MLRHEDGTHRHRRRHSCDGGLAEAKNSEREIAYPSGARVDAGLHRRSGGGRSGGDARRDGGNGRQTAKINPLVPVDLVIDHSVMVDHFGTAQAFKKNVELEYERNGERYEFLRWGQARSTISASCRRAPAFATRSIWNISRRRCGRRQVGERHLSLIPTPGRHRQPHHHGQRACRAGLGRRRHRGGSGDARPAGVDADPGGGRLQADWHVSPKASRRPTWC